MLVGVIVGGVVAVGPGVLLGEGEAVGVWLALGTTVVGAEVAKTALDGVSTIAGLQPVIITKRNNPKIIPAIRLSLLFLPVNGFILDGDYLGR